MWTRPGLCPGASHGGYGAFVIGPKMPDRFAAVHASAAAPTDGETRSENLRDLRFTVMVGDRDTAYGRADRCRAFIKHDRGPEGPLRRLSRRGRDPAGRRPFGTRPRHGGRMLTAGRSPGRTASSGRCPTTFSSTSTGSRPRAPTHRAGSRPRARQHDHAEDRAPG